MKLSHVHPPKLVRYTVRPARRRLPQVELQIDIDIEKAKRLFYGQLAAEALRQMKADGALNYAK